MDIICLMGIGATLVRPLGLNFVVRSIEATTTEVGSFLLLLVTLCLAITYFRVRKLYRCPRCNHVPTRTAFGWRDEFGREAKDVQWNPAERPTCHASLREEGTSA
jgi:hypothetical protein